MGILDEAEKLDEKDMKDLLRDMAEKDRKILEMLEEILEEIKAMRTAEEAKTGRLIKPEK